MTRLGLSVPAILGLAALALPRAVLHDLHVGGTAVAAVLALVPVAIWIAVALAARVPRPLLTVVAIGAVYGVLLAIVHQLLWVENFDGDPPRLGGNLADAPDWVHEVVMRGGVVFSSVMTGVLVGLVGGLIAAGLARLRSR